MPIIKGLEWTFDTVASKYAKYRPGYVDELYKMIFDYITISSASNVVEVGIGGGQATLPILKTGCNIIAIECGENFSKLCEEKFKEYRNFFVITNKFENVSFPDDKYDLVYSASAFHWVPEDIGYPKVYAMLKSGGAFARFANHPYRDKGNRELSDEIDKLYCKYYNKYYGLDAKVEDEYSEDQALQRAQIAEKYGFIDIKYALFHRMRTFSAKEYIELLGTYSDHVAMKETIRTEFFSKIEEIINEYGGSYTLYDIIDLQLARKP